MNKNYYCIQGVFNFRNADTEMLLENEFKEEERHLQAYSRDQATFLFDKRFTKKLGRRVYLGNADIFRVEPPKAVQKGRKEKQKKKGKQLSLFRNLN